MIHNIFVHPVTVRAHAFGMLFMLVYNSEGHR